MIEQKIALGVTNEMTGEDYIDVYVRTDLKDNSVYPCMTCYYEQNINHLNRKQLESILKELEFIKQTIKDHILDIRVCPYCEKEFVPENKTQKYCCDRHRTSYNRRMYEKEHPEKSRERSKLRYLRRLGEKK